MNPQEILRRLADERYVAQITTRGSAANPRPANEAEAEQYDDAREITVLLATTRRLRGVRQLQAKALLGNRLKAYVEKYQDAP